VARSVRKAVRAAAVNKVVAAKVGQGGGGDSVRASARLRREIMAGGEFPNSSPALIYDSEFQITNQIKEIEFMKKKLALIGALSGIGGLVYALESRRRKRIARDENGTNDQSSPSDDRSAQSSFGTKQDGDRGEERAASMARIENGRAVIGEESDHVIDDHGTDQAEAAEILRNIRDNAFEASDQKLALALGRPTEEIAEWTGGRGPVDGDVLMKARTLAMQRGFEI
jgi:hypothetical protein